MRLSSTAFAIALAGILAPAMTAVPAPAQDVPSVSNPNRLQVDRQELNELLVELEEASTSRAYSGEMRRDAAAQAARVRHRLAEGDFRPGDRVVLTVRGEPELSGEFTVEAGPTITLPDVGPISLHGVLRSELEDHVRQELARYLQNPVVQARSLIRVAVVGEVGSPGFFTLPASIIMEDVVMTAGGPTRNANLDRIRIERSGDAIWRDQALQEAMLQARTLDQLDVQAGDRIVVPARGTRILSWTGFVTILTTVGTLAYLYRRVF